MCIPNQLSPSVSKRELHLKISLQPQFHQLSVRVLNGQKQNTLPCQCNQKAAEGATVTRPFPGSPPPLSELLGRVIRQVAVLHAHYCRLHLLLTEEDAIAIGKGCTQQLPATTHHLVWDCPSFSSNLWQSEWCLQSRVTGLQIRRLHAV